MKKIALFLFLSIICICGKSQEANYWAHATGPHYIYVGSLPKSSSHVNEKLKIEIFGGGLGGSDTGTTIYSAGVREKSYITIERTGGDGTWAFDLVVYENGNIYDFVIKTISQHTSMNIKSTFLTVSRQLNSIVPRQNVNIKKYDPTGMRIATSDFTQTIVTATNRVGDFGIGTLAPKSKLDVRGKIIADEVEVKVNKGADFVFSSDYNLKSLSEVETFIKENNHLPDIPSEKEMQENGLNLNNMQIKLLQKIEELTLYVIEQDKKINSLEKQLDEK